MTKSPQTDTLAALVAARDEAREILRELHGVIKDAKQAKKEIADLLQQGTTLLVLSAVEAALEKHIEITTNRFQQAVNDGTDKFKFQLSQLSASVREREAYVEETAKTVIALSNVVKEKIEIWQDWVEAVDKQLDSHGNMLIHLSHLTLEGGESNG